MTELNAMPEFPYSKEYLSSYIEDSWDQIIEDMRAVISVDSPSNTELAEDGAPYGPACREALDTTLAIAQRLGFKTEVVGDGRLGICDLPATAGEELPQIATIAHVDIVPTGPGWNFDPLTVTKKDGYLIGRGVADDKGPAILSLYALAFFIEHEIKLPSHLRGIIGSSEETGMEDARWYVENMEQPDFCFTPDSEFPLVCGEKGGVDMRLSSVAFKPSTEGSFVEHVEGGTVRNAIAASASARICLNGASVPEVEDGIELELEGDKLLVKAVGIGGHASLPAGTRNAIGMLGAFIARHGLCSSEQIPFFEFLGHHLAKTDGSTFGIAADDDMFTPLTITGGVITTVEEAAGLRFVQTLDCRYPKSITAEEVCAGVEKSAGQANISFEKVSSRPTFYQDPSSDYVQAMLKAYSDWTGEPAQAHTVGGGTYAHHFKSAVSFGPNLASLKMPDWVGAEHGPDEGISEQLMKDALAIYIKALWGLAHVA